MNERLRAAITQAGLTPARLAEEAGLDPKTVERWITKDRVPHRSHRWEVCRRLGSDELYLWPSLAEGQRALTASREELIALYPDRGSVSATLWRSLINSATTKVDILVYAGLFLWDTFPQLSEQLACKAAAGCQVRLAIGDPAGPAVQLRGAEEGIYDGMAGRARLTLTYLEPVLEEPGVQVRLHDTTLYNSLFRFDEDLIVNAHTYGAPAVRSPVLHLHHVSGGVMFHNYTQSFERVWEMARPIKPARQHSPAQSALQECHA